MGRPAVVFVLLVSACAASKADPPIGAPTDAGDAPADADTPAPVETGACADGYVRCGRLCLDASLVDDACRPAACATGIAATATPRSARGFVASFDFDGAAARATVR